MIAKTNGRLNYFGASDANSKGARRKTSRSQKRRDNRVAFRIEQVAY